MAVGGVGGLLGQMINPGLDDRIATHMTPNPNPLAQQGVASQDPKAVDSLGNAVPQQPAQPGANLAPGAYTQPDPVNNSYIKDLLTRQRIDANAATFNEGLDQMAASFGTAQQQASKQQARSHGGGVGGGLADLMDMQKMQDQTIQDNEHARFMSNAAVFAQTLSQSLGRPVSVQEATEIMNNPDTMKMVTGAAGANMQTTGTQKDAEAATRAWADAHPEATRKDIADYKANLIAGGMGGNDLETRQYLDEKRNGLTTDDIATWKAKKAAQAAGLVTQAKDAQDFKDTATQDYTAVHSKLTDMQKYVDVLTADPEATRKAMVMPFTSGVGGALNPLVDQKVKDAAVALNKIRSGLTAEGLSNVKNVRNVKEFQTLGQAATAGLDPAASDVEFKGALDSLKNRYLDAQATAELSVGHRLTGDLVGHGNRDLLDPKSPYFNGGSEEARPDFSKMSSADADAAYEKLPSGSVFVDTDGKPKKKP